MSISGTNLQPSQPDFGGHFGGLHAQSFLNNPTGIDRFRPAETSVPVQRALTSVEQGEAARQADASNKSVKIAAAPAIKAPAKPHSPISVSSTVTYRADGTKVDTIYIDVKANFLVDGGTLGSGTTAKARAKAIETSIEKDFSKTYKNKDGSITRYVTRVDMTVGKAASAGREQFILVKAGDSRLGGGSGTLGIAPGFENGNTAYISDAAGARTAPHEFGHLAGLRHTAQVDQGCTTEPGIKVDNLMSQTGCSATSQRIERSQLWQIYNTPNFR
jgi:hypothetical protein